MIARLGRHVFVLVIVGACRRHRRAWPGGLGCDIAGIAGWLGLGAALALVVDACCVPARVGATCLRSSAACTVDSFRLGGGVFIACGVPIAKQVAIPHCAHWAVGVLS